MNYSINDLKIFSWVVSHQSLSAAARQAQVTPAAVSAIVKRLETDVGVRLLERNSRACRLTAAGEQFHAAAESALTSLRECESAVRHAGREPHGSVRIAAPADLSRTALTHCLDEFQRRYPNVEVVVSLSDSVQDLMRNAIDLALRYGDLPDSSLVARKLCSTRRVTVAAPAYWDRRGRPAAPEDLQSHDCLCFNVGGKLDAVWRYNGKQGRVQRILVHGRRHSNDSSLVRQWAIEGLGVINKSDLDVREDIAAGRLEQVLTEWEGPQIPLSLVYAGSSRRPAAVLALANFLQHHLID